MSPNVPAYSDLLWPTIEALKALGGSAANDELLEKIIEIEKIPEAVQLVPHKNGIQSELSYRLAWAKTYLNKSGSIENPSRGVWTLTKYGESLTKADCEKIPKLIRDRAAQKKQNLVVRQKESPNSNTDAQESWKDKLINALLNLKPDAFERLAQRILREAGFIKVEVSGRSGDGGIDGVGVLRVNLLSFQVLFQCKRYQGTVGAGTVRDFRGAMVGRTDKGLIITTGTFSADARREATRDGAPAIDLIDGDRLCDLMKNLKLGIRIEIVEKISVDENWIASL
jgi:restriction system protein